MGFIIVFWVSCGFWVLWVCSSLWVFLGFLCGLAELLLCILPVYLGAPYTFFNEIFFKKNKKFRFIFIFFYTSPLKFNF